MLRTLTAKDFVIIEHAELELLGGMTALTGETGAGKSLIVDALMLLSGGRGDAGSVRAGCERAELAASFDLGHAPHVQDWLRQRELDEADAECQVRRVLRADGSSRAYVNGRSVTLGTLRQLSELLLEIHGQHEHQALLRPLRQRQLLDALGQHGTQRARVAALAATWVSLQHEAQALQPLLGTDPGEAERLQSQVEELERHALGPTALSELEHEHRRLTHLDELLQHCRHAGALLDGEQPSSVRRALHQAMESLKRAAQYDAQLETAVSLLNEASIQVDESNRMLERYSETQETEPARLQELEARLSKLHELSRKYRVAIPDLSAHGRELAQRHALLGGAQERASQLALRQREVFAEYAQAAGELSAARQRCASRLAAQVTESIASLGMPGGQFEVQVTHQPEATPLADGWDQVEFLISANPGQPARPLRKIASGGELSRVSLAIEVAMMDEIEAPTLVFDEVDSGIGGATAEIVGRKLRALGRNRQVLCVTHLPQVAAQAHQQVRISKESSAAHTHTRVQALDERQRIEEISRMLGGVHITQQTRANAEEMLAHAATAD